MSNNININTESLLGTLNEYQVEALIQEEELKSKGYRFYYTVDNYDFAKYCFPIGIEEPDLEYSINYLSDQNIAYNEFLINKDVPMILLDEYLNEFIDFRNKYVRCLLFGLEVLNTAKKFKEGIRNYQDNFFGLLISYVLSIPEKGGHRINKLIDKKQLIVSYEDFRETSLLRENEKEDLIQNFIDAVPRSQKYSLLFNKLSSFKESKENDCKAIDRVTQINESLIKKGSKSLILYLSSDSSSRNELFTKSIDSYFPRIEGKYFRFHRTSAQLFLQVLLRKEKKPIELLNEIKDLTISKSSVEFNKSLKYLFDKKINELRNSYAHENLIHQFEQFQIMISEGMKAALGKERNFISDLFDRAQKEFNEKKKSFDQIIHGLTKALQFEYVLINALNNWHDSHKKSKSKELFLIQRGKDPIFGTGHHLPQLFRSSSHNDALFKIANLCLKYEIEVLERKETRINDVIEVSFDKYLNDIKQWSSDENRLAGCLMYMIINLPIAQNRATEPVENIVYQILKKSPEELNPHSIIDSDYLYMLVWLKRRNKEYELSITQATIGTELYPTDPRFYHGNALAYYCLYRERNVDYLLEKANSESCVFIKSAYNAATQALFLYSEPLFFQSEDLLFHKSHAALMCSQALFATLMARDFSDITYLREARILINELKKYENGNTNHGVPNIKGSYYKYPEYRYVESIVEYYEYLYLPEIESKSKLKNAKIAISDALKIYLGREEYRIWDEFLNSI